MSDEGWLRDRLFDHAAELGGQKARQEAIDADVVQLRQEVRDRLVEQKHSIEDVKRSMKDDLQRESMHIRGEITRVSELLGQQKKMLDDQRQDVEAAAKKRSEEAQHRNEELIKELRSSGQRSRSFNQYIIYAIILAAAGAQALVENLPTMLHLIGLQ